VFVESSVAALRPARVHLCDGSAREQAALLSDLQQTGALVAAGGRWKNCFLARSPPSDVARVEARTYIACGAREDAGPLNNWREPGALRAELAGKFAGASAGRTLYFLPFSMAPPGSPFALLGVQATDSAYAVANMHIMARTGPAVLAALDAGAPFVPGLHSVGAPLAPGEPDVPWPQNAADKCIAHFPVRGGWASGCWGALPRTPWRAQQLRHPSPPRLSALRPRAGEPRDHELRLRLRRQCAARQEVPGAAHCVGGGAGGGVAS